MVGIEDQNQYKKNNINGVKKSQSFSSQKFIKEDTVAWQDKDINTFRLDSLSDEDLAERRDTARRVLSGDMYKPEARSGTTIVGKELATLQKEALSKAKRTAGLMEEQKQTVSSVGTNDLTGAKIFTEKNQKLVKEINTTNHTLDKNLQSKIKNEKISLAQIVLEEQSKRRTLEQSNFVPQKRMWQRIILILSILLVLLGGVTIIYIVFFSENVQNIPISPEINKNYLITPNSERRIVTIGIQNEEIRNIYKKILTTTEAGTKEIQSIAFVKEEKPEKIEYNIEEVFNILNIIPPDKFLRALSKEYMIGIYTGENNASFFVLKVLSFENSFNGMLSWEKTSLNELADILSTRQISPKERDTRWADASIRNIDVRLLIDSTNDIFLIYSFLDKKTLIIAPDKNTFIELVDRYNTPQKVLR